MALVGSACDPAPSSAPLHVEPSTPSGRQLSVPSIPLPPANAWTVDPTTLLQVPCDSACVADPAHPDSARYFYGELPLGTVDALMAGHWSDGTPVDVRAALGNLFVSGYFGGIYLRANLGSIGVDPAATPMKALLDALGSGAQQVIDALVGELVRVARTGSDAEVRSTATGWAVVLSAVHGYNRGYLDVALANPPSGLASVAAPMTCASQFDCRSSSMPLAALDALAPTLWHLAHPDSLEWLAAGQGTAALADAASSAGHDVWTGLLADADFDATAYKSIVDLSVGFLEINQAALLADIEGGIGDVAVGRRGLLVSAALLVWAGSYFLGLASSSPNGQLPSIG